MIFHNYNLYGLIGYFHEGQLTDGFLSLKVMRRKSFLSLDPWPGKSKERVLVFHTSGSGTVFPSPVWVNVSEDLPFSASINGMGIVEGGKW